MNPKKGATIAAALSRPQAARLTASSMTVKRPRRSQTSLVGSRTGERTPRPTLSYGQARTQLKQLVQSMLDWIVGANRPVSQPGKKPWPFGLVISLKGMKAASPLASASSKYVSRPCRHGLCSQLAQTFGSSATTWVGDVCDSTKLKLPSGQT